MKFLVLVAMLFTACSESPEKSHEHVIYNDGCHALCIDGVVTNDKVITSWNYLNSFSISKDQCTRCLKIIKTGERTIDYTFVTCHE